MSDVVHLLVPEMVKRRNRDSAPVILVDREIDIIDPTRRPGEWQNAGQVARRIGERLVAARFKVVDGANIERCAP